MAVKQHKLLVEGVEVVVDYTDRNAQLTTEAEQQLKGYSITIECDNKEHAEAAASSVFIRWGLVAYSGRDEDYFGDFTHFAVFTCDSFEMAYKCFKELDARYASVSLCSFINED